MSRIQNIKQIPGVSLILKDFDKIHYLDCYAIQIQSGISVDKITTDVFMATKLVNILMSLRNNIVGLFGLKKGNKDDINNNKEPYYPVGSKAVYFTVLDRNENEIVMAENDKHLNFRTSVMLEKGAESSFVYLSTIVQYNNFFGRIYFLPVKPFHRIIIKSLLKKYANEN